VPDDDVTLSAEAAAVANQIKAIDAEIADVDDRTKRVLGLGMMGGRFSGHQAEDRLDERRDGLLQKRVELVGRLKALTGVS
jgi:hypothetical protein